MMVKCRMRRGWLMALLLVCGGMGGALHGQTAVSAPAQTAPPQAKPAESAPPAADVASSARPGELYQEAMKPLDVVRSSLDNWSDAELGALRVGIHMAREGCEQISIKALAEEDLFDLIRLCALGQDWTKTNTAALNYLASGADPHRTQAYAMSLNALTRLTDRDGAVKTAEEMLHSLPYDAEVAYALRYFEIYLSYGSDPAALTLATEEHAALVEALQTGLPLKAVHGGAVMGVGEVFDSGLRLAFFQRYAGDTRGAERTCAELNAALTNAATSNAISAVDRRLISAVETQYKLLGAQLPEIDARRFLTAPMTKTKVGFDPGFVTVLAIFPEWCPQCTKVMQRLSEFAAEHAAARVRGVGLMVQESKPDPGPDPKSDSDPPRDYKALKGTATMAVTEEAAGVFGAVDYPLIVVTDSKGIVNFVGLVPENAFVPNGYMEQVIGRIVGETVVIRNVAGKTKAAAKKPS